MRFLKAYLKAYLKAWMELFCWASSFYLILASIFYVFKLQVDPYVIFYLLWVVSLVAVGGVVREGMKKNWDNANQIAIDSFISCGLTKEQAEDWALRDTKPDYETECKVRRILIKKWSK